MGGWDVYCCFCGAVATYPGWDPSSEEEYDARVLARENITSPEQLGWMKDVRLLGYNSESRSINKAFISGPATYADFGSFSTDPGEDPNFFTMEQMPRCLDGFTLLNAYQPENNESVNIPFHISCYEAVFKPLVAHLTTAKDNEEIEINTDVLFGVLSSFCTEEFGNCLQIDYGKITELQEQYWWNHKGSETFACNPGDVPRLRRLYENLPKLASQQPPTSEVTQEEEDQSRSNCNFSPYFDGRTKEDPFAVLPVEINLEIMLLVSPATVNSLRIAAPSTRQIALSNGYWRARVFNDMPWLYDLHSSLSREEEVKIDWVSTYEIFLRASEKDNKNTILGLVNRRRIWMICEVLAMEYVKKLKEGNHEKQQADLCLAGLSLSTTPMSRVAWPSAFSKNTFHIPAISSPSAIATIPLAIKAEFNEKGRLAGITIERMESHQPLSDFTTAQGNHAFIPTGDWLKGLMLTLEKTGDGYCDCAVVGITVLSIKSPPVSIGITLGNKKLLHISNNHWFVGLKGEIYDNLVSRLALLEGTCDTVLPANLISVTPWRNMPSENLLKYMWKDVFPSYDMDVTLVEPGYWNHSTPVDLMPLERLTFGTTEEELNDVTAFACDALFMSFQIHYSNRPIKAIGPRSNALRTFPINGRRGERVVGINTGITNIGHAMHLLTNFGRHCMFGSSSLVESLTPEADRTMAGIVCSWAYNSTHLTTISMLTSPSTMEAEQHHQPHDWYQWSKDNEDRFWDPDPPPSTWKEIGPMYGDNRERIKVDMGGNNCVPERANIASWLDFTKSIQKVEVWQVHPQRKRENRTQFKSLILHFADGTHGAVGPDQFNPAYCERLSSTEPHTTMMSEDEVASDSSKKNGGTCDCDQYWKDCPDWPSKHHFFGHEWTLNGERIVSIKIWALVYMDGIQFTSESGLQSPVYGFAEGNPTGVIEFGAKKGSEGCLVKGLKLVLDHNARPVTQQDIIILGMQALGEEVVSGDMATEGM